jgi:putative polyhydroxyalkanoate system protein
MMAASTAKEAGMPDIHIVHPHKLSAKKARDAAQKVADKIAEEYDLECEWDGDTLYFERSGVNGAMELGEGQVEMTIKLGFLMGAFSSTIQAKIEENLKKVFG